LFEEAEGGLAHGEGTNGIYLHDCVCDVCVFMCVCVCVFMFVCVFYVCMCVDWGECGGTYTDGLLSKELQDCKKGAV